MIPANPEPWEPNAWRLLLKTAIRDSTTLCQHLGLDVVDIDRAPDFPVRVPFPFLRRMAKGDPNDPLLKQVLATSSEREKVDGFVADAVGETGRFIAPALMQKYAHRALLIASPACAVHCRYCFRRQFPYEAHGPSVLDHAMQALVADPEITEIILSGGDPLTLPDEAFSVLLIQLYGISHLRRIRIHTRWPIVIPERITQALLDVFQASPKPITVVVHCNHANELDADTARAFKLLRIAGVTLLNQAVLLGGVNDDTERLSELSEQLFNQGVLPYYLHLLDPVDGAHHFDVSAATGIELIRALRDRLPGYLVPRLVRETAGEPAKTLVI